MHWSLAELREMDAEEYHELIEWAKDKGKKDDPDSRDIDAMLDAKKAKEAAE
jgi:hypothetical protein